MNIFMKIVLIVAVVAILTGVIGGIITASNHKAQIESGELDRGAKLEEHKNNMHDDDDYDMMKQGKRNGSNRHGSGGRGESNSEGEDRGSQDSRGGAK